MLKKQSEKAKYDQGTITFRAKRGRLIELDKLHESIWATRLSGGTRSGLVSLEVTVVGEAVIKRDNNKSEIIFDVAGSDAYFVLTEGSKSPASEPQNVLDYTLKEGARAKQRATFDDLKRHLRSGGRVVRVTGFVDGWEGRWPEVLRRLPARPRRIVVTSFRTGPADGSSERGIKEKEQEKEKQKEKKQ